MKICWKMEPLHIPEINLHKADLMRTELLIQAHQWQLVQYVKQLYNMDLHIHVSTSHSLNLCVHIHLQHIPTQEQSNTIKCLCPGSDIIGCLEEHVYNEILDLNTHILDTPRRRDIHSWNVTLLSLKTKRLKVYKLIICVH